MTGDHLKPHAARGLVQLRRTAISCKSAARICSNNLRKASHPEPVVMLSETWKRAPLLPSAAVPFFRTGPAIASQVIA